MTGRQKVSRAKLEPPDRQDLAACRQPALSSGSTQVTVHTSSERISHATSAPLAAFRDFVALTKPRITLLVLFTSAAAMAVAPGHLTSVRLLSSLVGTALVVSSANVLNMWWERDLDAKMTRTSRRPLPAGRLDARSALWFGLALAAIATPILAAVNMLTCALGLFALATYVLAYTPLKTRSWLALLVGAVPGALPPLMGWSTVTGQIDLAALSLFAVLFLWQVPHFGAISLFRTEEYARAGMQVLAVERGEQGALRTILMFTLLLVASTVLVHTLGVAGATYLVVSIVAGAAFVVMAFAGLQVKATIPWSKRLFALSIVYLVVWMGALVFDRTAS